MLLQTKARLCEAGDKPTLRLLRTPCRARSRHNKDVVLGTPDRATLKLEAFVPEPSKCSQALVEAVVQTHARVDCLLEALGDCGGMLHALDPCIPRPLTRLHNLLIPM